MTDLSNNIYTIYIATKNNKKHDRCFRTR